MFEFKCLDLNAHQPLSVFCDFGSLCGPICDPLCDPLIFSPNHSPRNTGGNHWGEPHIGPHGGPHSVARVLVGPPFCCYMLQW